MIAKSWNTSRKIMFSLPVATHKFFIEPVSNKKHIKSILLKRFLGFVRQVENSPKLLPKSLLTLIKNDTRSTTGSNLRNIMLLLQKNRIEEINAKDVDTLIYNPVECDQMWKIAFVKELVEVKANQMEVENFDQEEIEEILQYICTS